VIRVPWSFPPQKKVNFFFLTPICIFGKTRVTAGNEFSREKSEKAKTIKQKKKIKLMKNRLKIFTTILSVFACFGLLSGAQAMDVGNGNTAEGFNADGNDSVGVFNTAIGWFSLGFNGVNGTGNFNTAVGAGSLDINAGDSNTAVGIEALLLNITATTNTAVGTQALVFNDFTATSPSTANNNTAVGDLALWLNLDGGNNTAVGARALLNNDFTGNGFATDNTAVGVDALFLNSDGNRNCAFGSGALFLNQVSGNASNAFGFEALFNNDSDAAGLGLFNNAFGWEALFSNVDGVWNTAMGDGAGSGITGDHNTAIGAVTMETASTGAENTVLGFDAGNNIIAGSGNIYLGVRAGAGVGDEVAFIRIGEAAPPIVYDTFIQGIWGRFTIDPGSTVPVLVDSNGKVAQFASSRRYKHDIQPMDKASEAILALKPVAFHYNEDKKNTPCFGLIAEDVAEVNPALVVLDKNGEPLTVRYEQINAMLLNEFLKEHKKVEEQQASISQLKSEMQTMVAQLKEQAAQIQKVSAQLEVNKPAPQVVVNKP